jgi:beta-1,4-mannosyltransferase
MYPGSTPSDDNQFINLLVENLDSEIEIINFNWFFAIFGSYKILHVHWQERLYKAKNPIKSWIKRFLFLILFLMLKIRKSKVIWTVHNLVPHESLSRLEKKFERKFKNVVHIRVYLQPNEGSTESHYFIPHGLYNLQELSKYDFKKNPNVIQVVCAGFLRPSKNLERLIQFFPENRSISLLIAGEPISDAYGIQIEKLANSKSNIEIRLGRLSQVELYEIYRTADYGIVPYIDTYNSGAAIYALSVPIPLLATESETMLLLQKEVGPSWMQLFRHDFDSLDIVTAIDRIKKYDFSRTDRPIFSVERQWARIGEKYSKIYRSALGD